MNKCTETFPIESESCKLYSDALALYEKIERENARSAYVNGISLGYLEFGSEDGLPFFWIHASGSTAYDMAMVQAGLVAEGYRVIAIDCRGHGRSQLEYTPYNSSLYHIADDVAALMDHLNIEKAVLGGVMTGGFAATAFYDSYPDRVLGLMLESGGSFSPLRLEEDVRLGLVLRGAEPFPEQENARLCDTTLYFSSRLEGVRAVWSAFAPAFGEIRNSVGFIAGLFSTLRQCDEDTWQFHFEAIKFLLDDGSHPPMTDPGVRLYSRIPLMQQSKELMNPRIIFRNLSLPLHIIDAVSPADYMPVTQQNRELYLQHPDWVEHELYQYQHSPNEAHIERPERFIASANTLLLKVVKHWQLQEELNRAL